MARRRLTILLSGMIAGDPHQGGATWAVLQYLLGLRRLGHDVLFIEPLNKKSLQPTDVALEDSVNARYFRQIVESFHLADAAALLVTDTRESVGLPYERIRDLAQ